MFFVLVATATEEQLFILWLDLGSLVCLSDAVEAADAVEAGKLDVSSLVCLSNAVEVADAVEAGKLDLGSPVCLSDAAHFT